MKRCALTVLLFYFRSINALRSLAPISSLQKSIFRFNTLVHNSYTAINDPMDPIPEKKIEQVFYERMSGSPAPIFHDLETYKSYLPVWKSLKLYELAYFAHPSDMKLMADTLLKPCNLKQEGQVFYISGPTGSGKTASVLPAFLECAKRPDGFSHYLFLASSNARNNFQAHPYSIKATDSATAYSQGADFILDSLKILLDATAIKQGTIVTIRDYRPIENIKQDLKTLFNEKLGPGYKCLVHLDAHFRMCSREEPDTAEMGECFTQGAMETLAKIQGVTVICTHIGGVPVPPAGTSSICRIPVNNPCIDINQVISYYGIPLPWYGKKILYQDERQIRSILKFLLALKLTNYKSWLIDEEERSEFFKKLRDVKISGSVMQKYKEFSYIVEEDRSRPYSEDSNLLKYFIGWSDCDDLWECRKTDYRKTVITMGGELDKVGAGFWHLSNLSPGTLSDQKNLLFMNGRELFNQVVSSDVLYLNKLGITPLSAAYVWVLSCRSAVLGCIDFTHHLKAQFSCIELKSLKISADSDEINNDINGLKENTMYYAAYEKMSTKDNAFISSYPLADIFFITDNKELVLIDVSSDQKIKTIENKKNRLSKKINQNQSKITKYSLVGVILAPLVDTESVQDGNIHVICGKDAASLLGSLAPMRNWFADDEDDDEF